MRCDICGQKECCGAELQHELTAAKAEIERLRGRESELEKCVDDGSDAWLLRKQAEALENLAERLAWGHVVDQIKEEAQRLRNQADELEKSGGTHD